MSSWEEILGNRQSLEVPKIREAMILFIYKTGLFVRKDMVNLGKDVDESFKDPWEISLSFDEEKTIADFDGEKKNKPKFTYETQATEQEEITGEDGKKRKRAIKNGTKKTVTKNKAKWFTATADFRTTLTFLLRRYVKEMEEFYAAKGKRFPDESTVLTEFLNWSSSQTIGFDQFYITPMILSVTNKILINKTVEPVFENLDQQLFNKVSDIFKDSNGAVPSLQVNKMVGSFVQFVKIIAVKMAYQLWYKKLKVDSVLILSIIRDLVLVLNKEVALEENFFKAIKDYNDEAAKLLEDKKEESKQKKEKNQANGTSPSAVEGTTDDTEDLNSALESQDNTWDEEAAPDEEF
jgi:hypothetical protein